MGKGFPRRSLDALRRPPGSFESRFNPLHPNSPPLPMNHPLERTTGVRGVGQISRVSTRTRSE